MRILVEPSGYDASNHGDFAQLFVALKRLTSFTPKLTVMEVTTETEELTSRFTGLEFVNAGDRNSFFRSILPGTTSPALLRAERSLLVRSPHLWSQLLLLRQNLNRLLRGVQPEGNPMRFAEQVSTADAMILSGSGVINDSFFGHAMSLLEEMDIFLSSGRKVYLLGQGIGPLDHPELREKARQILPRVTRIFIREHLQGPDLLASLGVAPEKIQLTGDDAIELACPFTPPELGNELGVNVRINPFAGLGVAAATAIGRAIRETAAELKAPLRPIPISRHHETDDLLDAYKYILDEKPPASVLPREKVEQVIEAAGKCRVVVTGAYHAAVFALSQGGSAVCLIQSPYYVGKFGGLQGQFGKGCELVRLDLETEETLGAALSDAIRRAWHNAPEVRATLQATAKAQAEASSKAHREMALDLAATPAPGDY